jgi:hypothetical protein
MDCDQTAMSLPFVSSAVFLIAHHFGEMCVSRRNILDASATPLGIKHEWYDVFIPRQNVYAVLVQNQLEQFDSF